MMGPIEAAARGFERAILAVQKPASCHIQLDPDSFDGHTYTIEDFYNKVRPSFANPSEFFKDFAYPGAPNLRASISDGPRRPGADYDALFFDAPLPTEWEANNRVPFKWFYEPKNRARVLLLIAPGWARADQSVEITIARRLRRHGIDVGLMTVPFHLQRAPEGSYSGEFFISPNLFWTIANFRQFAAEIRLLVQYMRQQYDYVGIIGLSSGGFQAGLASLGEPIDFLFPVMTGCHLGSIVFSGTLTERLRSDIQHRGIDEGSLNRIWSITDMVNVGHACKARYRKQYVTRFDSIIPPRFQEALWEIYGRPDRKDLNTSHYGIFFALRSIADDIAAYVEHCIPKRGLAGITAPVASEAFDGASSPSTAVACTAATDGIDSTAVK